MSERDSEDHAATIREVEESQQELSQALGDLEGIVRRGIDPARWVTERPLPWLLGGFALGLWLGIKR
jgi:uncharacterized protein with PhoU and TrkA domain